MDDGKFILTGVLGLLIGAFSLLGGIFNWDWFYNARKASGMVRIFGRTGARIFYSVLGVIIIVGSLVCIIMGTSAPSL